MYIVINVQISKGLFPELPIRRLLIVRCMKICIYTVSMHIDVRNIDSVVNTFGYVLSEREGVSPDSL